MLPGYNVLTVTDFTNHTHTINLEKIIDIEWWWSDVTKDFGGAFVTLEGVRDRIDLPKRDADRVYDRLSGIINANYRPDAAYPELTPIAKLSTGSSSYVHLIPDRDAVSVTVQLSKLPDSKPMRYQTSNPDSLRFVLTLPVEVAAIPRFCDDVRDALQMLHEEAVQKLAGGGGESVS